MRSLLPQITAAIMVTLALIDQTSLCLKRALLCHALSVFQQLTMSTNSCHWNHTAVLPLPLQFPSCSRLSPVAPPLGDLIPSGTEQERYQWHPACGGSPCHCSPRCEGERETRRQLKLAIMHAQHQFTCDTVTISTVRRAFAAVISMILGFITLQFVCVLGVKAHSND